MKYLECYLYVMFALKVVLILILQPFPQKSMHEYVLHKFSFTIILFHVTIYSNELIPYVTLSVNLYMKIERSNSK